MTSEGLPRGGLPRGGLPRGGMMGGCMGGRSGERYLYRGATASFCGADGGQRIADGGWRTAARMCASTWCTYMH